MWSETQEMFAGAHPQKTMCPDGPLAGRSVGTQLPPSSDYQVVLVNGYYQVVLVNGYYLVVLVNGYYLVVSSK